MQNNSIKFLLIFYWQFRYGITLALGNKTADTNKSGYVQKAVWNWDDIWSRNIQFYCWTWQHITSRTTKLQHALFRLGQPICRVLHITLQSFHVSLLYYSLVNF